MAILSASRRTISLALLALVATAFASSARAGEVVNPIQVRLLTPLASYSKPGTSFRTLVIGSIETEGPSPLPAGSIVTGVVARSRSIGLGLKNERASLDLEFQTCQLPDGTQVKCEAALVGIDNARENVIRGGRIQGILAASHPHSWLGGVWYRPGTLISGRSASGLTGAGGKLQSILAPSAVGAGLAVVSRLLLFRLPNSEIELPAGVDLVLDLKLTGDTVPPIATAEPPDLRLSPAMTPHLAAVPVGVTYPDGRPAADIINLAVFGTAEELTAAFLAAGWSTADSLTTKTFAKSYAAAAAMRTYETAPVSPLRYQDREPDAVFQKSFNSMAKRHHIRFWRVESPDGDLWLGAATHDVAVAFDWARMVTHRIDPYIDAERRKVLHDLREAGCAPSYAEIPRPHWASEVESGAGITTDGALGVTRLDKCSTPQAKGRMKRPRRPLTTVIAGRFVLEARHYLTRGNAYYWAYRGLRRTFGGPKNTPIVKNVSKPDSTRTFPISTARLTS